MKATRVFAGATRVHDFMTVGADAAAAAAVTPLDFPDRYYEKTVREYADRRALMIEILDECGFDASQPNCAYYVMAGIDHLEFEDDVALAVRMVEDIGVAVVPGSSFFSRPELGRNVVRFSFCKRLETLHEAGQRLRRLQARR